MVFNASYWNWYIQRLRLSTNSGPSPNRVMECVQKPNISIICARPVRHWNDSPQGVECTATKQDANRYRVQAHNATHPPCKWSVYPLLQMMPSQNPVVNRRRMSCSHPVARRRRARCWGQTTQRGRIRKDKARCDGADGRCWMQQRWPPERRERRRGEAWDLTNFFVCFRLRLSFYLELVNRKRQVATACLTGEEVQLCNPTGAIFRICSWTPKKKEKNL